MDVPAKRGAGSQDAGQINGREEFLPDRPGRFYCHSGHFAFFCW